MRRSMLASIAGLAVAMATDAAMAGGLNSDDPAPAPTPTAETQAAAAAPASDAAVAKPKAAKASKPKAAKAADPVANEVTQLLTEGYKAVVWCAPGHAEHLPDDVVLVPQEQYAILRRNGTARDAEDGEVVSAVERGKISIR